MSFQTRPQIRKYSRSWLHFGVVLTGVFAFRYSIAEPYSIPSGSMEPTLFAGDRVLVLKSSYSLKVPFLGTELYRVGEPRRGDVVVFVSPRDPSINLIKRLVGLPGDRVEVKDGFVHVNGEPLRAWPTESGTSREIQLAIESARRIHDGGTRARYYEESWGEGERHPVQRLRLAELGETRVFEVPRGHYFFMGDNRDNSSDSREWGFAPESSLKGRARWVVASIGSGEGWAGLPRLRWERVGRGL